MALGWLIRFLIAAVAVRLAWKFVSGLLESAAERPRVPPKQGAMLARDPVCGTYVDRSRAVSARGGGEVHYFWDVHPPPPRQSIRGCQSNRDHPWIVQGCPRPPPT